MKIELLTSVPTQVSNSIFMGPDDGSGSPLAVTGEGALTLAGVNLFTSLNGTGLIDQPGNGDHIIVDTEPELAELDSYGGKTPTRPPLLGSPAIDGTTSTLSKDQREFPRPVGSAADIGAVEFSALQDITGYSAWATATIPIGEDRSFGGNADGDTLANGLESCRFRQ